MTEKEKSKEQSANLLSLFRTLAGFFCLFFILHGSVAQAFMIPSSSMETSLLIGDHLIVNKLSYGVRLIGIEKTLMEFDMPERNDIVVFTLPDNPNNLIKRVVALPGETVEVRDTVVFIDGKPIPDATPSVQWSLGGIKNFGPQTVPENRVFLLGDNRDRSKDSRFWEDPFLEVSRIKGRALFVYWPRLAIL